MIYENDIPPNNGYYLFNKVNKQLRLMEQDHSKRWKPNGITDNISEYRAKKAWRAIKAEMEMVDDGKTHDITESDFGFK